MKNKRLISFFLIISILTSVFAFSAFSASALSKPRVTSVENTDGGQELRWTNCGTNYHLYFGYVNNQNKVVWMKWRYVRGNGFETNLYTLRDGNWHNYLGNRTSISQLQSGVTYCYQIHAGNVNSKHQPTDKYYSNVIRWTYLAPPRLTTSITASRVVNGTRIPKNIRITASTAGASTYQFRYKKDSMQSYHYSEATSYGTVSWIYDATKRDRCTYEARAMLTRNGKTFYSDWSSVRKP